MFVNITDYVASGSDKYAVTERMYAYTHLPGRRAACSSRIKARAKIITVYGREREAAPERKKRMHVRICKQRAGKRYEPFEMIRSCDVHLAKSWISLSTVICTTAKNSEDFLTNLHKRVIHRLTLTMTMTMTKQMCK